MMPRSGTNTLSFWEFLWYDVENLLRNFDLDLKKKKKNISSIMSTQKFNVDQLKINKGKKDRQVIGTFCKFCSYKVCETSSCTTKHLY